MDNSLAELLDNHATRTPYQKGAADALRLLGLFNDNEKPESSGKVAQMFLDVLGAHLADGVTIGLDWENLDGPLPRGVDVIRAIETSRIERVDKPTPARVVRAALSIFKRSGTSADVGDDLYLMQFDAHARRYQPIGGKHESDETEPATALRREIAEELNLPMPPGENDCNIELVSDGWVETSLSATYGVLTQYTFSFFHIVSARFRLTIDNDTRWLTRREIAAGRASDGRSITPIYEQALGLNVLNGLAATTFETK